MGREVFFVQSYRARAARLVGEPARFFTDQASALGAARRLARFRAGVVVASQRVDPITGLGERPAPLVVLGRVPETWAKLRQAA